MADELSTGGSLERIVEYFQTSRFEYLALDCTGGSIRLSRAAPGSDVAATDRIEVRASTVGFVDLPAGRARFPEIGDGVLESEALFAIRRFKDVITVSAAASGMLHSVLVSKGDFVEFAQPLATLSRPD
jgi:biotin carboxyl carrier protein